MTAVPHAIPHKRTEIAKQQEEEEPIDANALLSTITSKIMGRHELNNEVTQIDLDNLATLADSDVEQEAIPYLHRNFLSNPPPPSSSSDPPIVRYTGMVQDILDPEYYVSSIHNTSTKYRDYYHLETNEKEEMDVHHFLKERQPLVIVPLPFGSGWVNEELVIKNKTVETLNKKKSDQQDCKKRERDDDITNEPETTDLVTNVTVKEENSRKQQKSITTSYNGDDNTTKSSLFAVNNQELKENGMGRNNADWWPKGCMGSDANQCPILAKVYYDDDDDNDENDKSCKTRKEQQRRLRLNDVVEVIGVVYMDPMDADFSSQQHQNQQNQQHVDVNNIQDWCKNATPDLDDRLVMPPPSLLPRFHVLCYQHLDLDEMSFKIASCNNEKDDVNLSGGEEDDDDRAITIATFSKYIFQNDEIAAEALLLSLLSLAQRQDNGNVIKTPNDASLGCASLNFMLPNVLSCKALEDRLNRVLQEIVPNVGSAILSLEMLMKGGITAPIKSCEGGGRLLSSPMQLPKGSTFLIQQSCLKEGKVDSDGQRTLMALSSLTSKHTMPYRFHGMLDYTFEADYRVIVLSSLETNEVEASRNRKKVGDNEDRNKLLPCMMQLKLNSYNSNHDTGMEICNNDEETETEESILQPAIAHRIRRYLSQCRSKHGGTANSTNIALSREIVQQAEKDFIQRRSEYRAKMETAASSRGAQCQGGVKQQQQHLVGEEDLHLWLTLTRLEARSRIGVTAGLVGDNEGGKEASEKGNVTATMQDWDAALKLYDAMMMRNHCDE